MKISGIAGKTGFDSELFDRIDTSWDEIANSIDWFSFSTLTGTSRSWFEVIFHTLDTLLLNAMITVGIVEQSLAL